MHWCLTNSTLTLKRLTKFLDIFSRCGSIDTEDLPPNCKLESDFSLPYPECCPELKCESAKEESAQEESAKEESVKEESSEM